MDSNEDVISRAENIIREAAQQINPTDSDEVLIKIKIKLIRAGLMAVVKTLDKIVYEGVNSKTLDEMTYIIRFLKHIILIMGGILDDRKRE